MSLLAFLLACNFSAGDAFQVTGVVVEVGGTQVVLDHNGADGTLGPGRDAFLSEPNLGRTVRPGDQVVANLMVTDDGTRAIGFRVTGHAPLAPTAIQVGEIFPTHTLPGTEGALTIGQGQGTPTVLTFLFTSCPLPNYCPLLASKLKLLQPEIAGTGRIVAVTLDPATDTLDVLDTWGQRYDRDPATWHFARLELGPLKDLLVYAGAEREQLEETVGHNLRLVVMDASGAVTWLGTDNSWDPAIVAEAVRNPE